MQCAVATQNQPVRVLVVGIANVQTTVPVDGFPVLYQPVRYLPGRIRVQIGGVGFNQARQLRALGNEVSLAAPLGADIAGRAIREELSTLGIHDSLCDDARPRHRVPWCWSNQMASAW